MVAPYLHKPEDVFWYLSNNPIIIEDGAWYLGTFQRVIERNVYSLQFESYNAKYISITITIMEDQLASAHDPITLIKETLRSAIVDNMNQPIGAMDTYASLLEPVGRNHNIAAVSAETTTGIAMTSSNQITINTISESNQGENKMDVKTLAYVAANMDKVTDLIDKWGIETGWETNAVIMVDYTYSKTAVIKKNNVVDANGDEVKIYTATVFKAKNGKWYSSLQNNILHGAGFGDVINFFENKVTTVKATSFAYNDGTVFISKDKAV